MDFDFSDDQLQLREAVGRWVDKAYTFERRRAAVAAGGCDLGIYQELAELGLCGLYVDEAHGGMGMGPVEGMIAMEALGRGLVMEPLAQTLMATAVLGAYAPEALKTDWLESMASGEKLVVLAYQERKARYRLDHCQTTATRQGDAWTVQGEKHVVPAGDLAQAFLVPAQTPEGLAMFLVEAGTNVKARGYGLQDGSRAADLVFQGAPATLVSTDGLSALEWAVDVGIAAACAEAVGIMDQVVATTAEYLNTRKQFGVAIGSFQALRHRIADMKMQLELARSMAYYANLKLNTPAAERRQAMARAKVQLGLSMRYVGQQAVQLHGGIGVTDEYVISHQFKRLTQLEMTFGDTLHHLGEVSDRMQETAGVFA